MTDKTEETPVQKTTPGGETWDGVPAMRDTRDADTRDDEETRGGGTAVQKKTAPEDIVWVQGDGQLLSFTGALPPGIIARMAARELRRVNEDGSPWVDPDEDEQVRDLALDADKRPRGVVLEDERGLAPDDSERGVQPDEHERQLGADPARVTAGQEVPPAARSQAIPAARMTASPAARSEPAVTPAHVPPPSAPPAPAKG
jgi:hypothetical protein